MVESSSKIAKSNIFNILIDTLTWSWGLPKLNDLIILVIYLSSDLIEESLEFVM